MSKKWKIKSIIFTFSTKNKNFYEAIKNFAQICFLIKLIWNFGVIFWDKTLLTEFDFDNKKLSISFCFVALHRTFNFIVLPIIFCHYKTQSSSKFLWKIFFKRKTIIEYRGSIFISPLACLRKLRLSNLRSYSPISKTSS